MPILDFPLPAQAGDTYRGYRYDGVKWNKIALTDPTVVYPTQSGNNGKFLTTNGAVVSWATVPPGEKGDRGDRGETGAQGVSVTLQGTKATIADLPAAPLDPNDYAGHGWIVTTGNGSTHLDGSLWFWNLSLGQWDDIGLIVGPQGDKGDRGDKGDQGDQGDPGPAGTTDYNELTNTPTNVSDFTNDVGYITATDRLVAGDKSVILGTDGVLTLANGSTIGDGDAGSGVPITTSRGSILLGNQAECAGGESHFHIMKAGQQDIDLFLGDDSNYVKLPSDGGVEISSSEIGNQHYWTFGTDGGITFPDATVQNTAWTGVVRQDTAPTAANGTLWFNTVEGRLYVKDDTLWVDASPQVPQETFSGDYNDLTNLPTLIDLGKFKIDTDSGTAILTTIRESGFSYGYDIAIAPSGEGNTIYIPNQANAILGQPISISANANSAVTISTDNAEWTFGTDGSLTLPQGGTINSSDGITLVTDRGTLVIGTQLETPGVAQHFHIAFDGSNSTPNANDLFLGDDYNYVKLPGYELNPGAQYGVEIGTKQRSGPQNVVVDAVDELVPPGGVWRLFIIIEDYPNLGSDVSIGDTVTTSWGTPITATVTGVVEAVGDGDWQIQVDQDITAGFSAGPKTVSFGSSGDSYTWRFGTDGVLTLPNGMIIDASDSIPTVTIGGPNTSIRIDDGGAPPGLYIRTDMTGADHGWLFGPDGELQFPDATVQTTAWQGSTVVSDTAPNNDLERIWFNSIDGRAYVKYNDVWVDIAPTIPVQVPTDISELTDDDGLLNNTGSGVTDYNDLDNLPTLFSGDYEDLTNTPSIPTDLNQLNNSSGFITGNGPSISNPTISFDGYFPIGTPSFNTSSTGTRFKLWPQASATESDYAIGIASTVLWNGIPQATDVYSFKWYGGTTEILKLQGNGKLTLSNSITFSDASVQTTAWTGVADYNNLINKPTYSFNVAADDSTLREISADETVKFIGAGGITTASDDEGSITITQGSTDTVIKVAGTFASDQPFKSEVIADLVNGVSISTWMGLPAFATNKTWKFGYNGNLTFPDTTVQSTAWTGSVAYASVTGTPTLATVATSGSYADLSSKPTIYTSAYIGTTSLAFNRSSASQTLNGVSIDGSAATLTTARNINGVSFDGSANINVPRITDGTNILKIVPAPTTLAGQAGDLKGNIAFTDTYLYYCKTAYGGTSYVATASSGQTAAYVVVRKSVAYTPAAGWTITFGTPLTISSVVDAGVVFGYDSWRLNLSTSVSSTGGSDYVLTDTSNTIWVQTPWNAITNSVTTLSSLTSVGTLTSLTTSGTVGITYTPGTATGYAITTTGKDTQGGTGYFDFLKATNTTSSATNPNKSFRLSNTGAVEIINSAYTTTILSLSDAGAFSVPGPISISGKQAVNGPAFSAYAAAVLQTIPNTTLTKVLFQTEEFDTNSNYASSKFTPTVEGYYQLNAEVRLDGASGTGEMMIMLYKNGTGYKRGTNQQGTQIAANFWAMQVSTVVYANGTTDYFEIYVQQGSGGSVSVTAVDSPAITWFNGCMLRGA